VGWDGDGDGAVEGSPPHLWTGKLNGGSFDLYVTLLFTFFLVLCFYACFSSPPLLCYAKFLSFQNIFFLTLLVDNRVLLFVRDSDDYYRRWYRSGKKIVI
jgi:hypothetical protein